MSVCQGCGTELPPQDHQGRPRKWCSERCRKAQYGGTCVDCGGSTDGGRGRSMAPARCAFCAAVACRVWTRESIIGAIREWDRRFGIPPTTSDWNSGLRARTSDCARRNEWYGSGHWPTATTVQRTFGSWNEAIEAAGFRARGPGDRLNREQVAA